MKKFNEFCEKYEASIWQLITAFWFFLYWILGTEKDALFGASIFWLVLAIVDFIQKSMKNKKK